jgi:RimK-like ATP-grasp domain
MVVQCCAARGISLYRFNSEDFPVSIGIELDPTKPDDARLLPTTGDPVDVGKARGIWLRRPQWPVIRSDVSDEGDRRLAVQESIAAVGGLWRLLAAKCVSAPDALQAARWKLPQLRLASWLGFAVPATIVTTDPGRAADLLRQGNVVLKAVQEMAIHMEGAVRSGYVEAAIEADAPGAAAAPILLQYRIPKIADWRVTVVGDTVFAARTATDPTGPLDVRAAEGNSTAYEERRLPDATSRACVAYLRTCGLRFGAFDLVEDQDRGLWFLECNANGQWGWIENDTGMRITDAIVSELLSCGDAYARPE